MFRVCQRDSKPSGYIVIDLGGAKELVHLQKLLAEITIEPTGWKKCNHCVLVDLCCCWNHDGDDGCFLNIVGSSEIDDAVADSR